MSHYNNKQLENYNKTASYLSESVEPVQTITEILFKFDDVLLEFLIDCSIRVYRSVSSL